MKPARAMTAHELAKALDGAAHDMKIRFAFCGMDVTDCSLRDTTPPTVRVRVAACARTGFSAKGLANKLAECPPDASVRAYSVESGRASPITGVRINGGVRYLVTDGEHNSLETMPPGLMPSKASTPTPLLIGVEDSRIEPNWEIIVYGRVVGKIVWTPKGYEARMTTGVVAALDADWSKMVAKLMKFLVSDFKDFVTRRALGDKG